jgi:hypothetical protein
MFTLRYPAVGSADTVILPNPVLGDIQRIATEGIVRRTTGGDLVGVRDADWPQKQVNVYEFVVLTETEKDDLLTFLENYAGLEIGITDHHGQEWTGVITSPENEIVTVKDTCSYGASFEFLGAKA